jgi:hypothetical protein
MGIINLIKNYDCEISLKKDLIETFIEIYGEDIKTEEKLNNIFSFSNKNKELFSEDSIKTLDKIAQEINFTFIPKEQINEKNIEIQKLKIETTKKNGWNISGNFSLLPDIKKFAESNYSILSTKKTFNNFFIGFLLLLLIFDIYIDGHKHLLTITSIFGIITPFLIGFSIFKGFSRQKVFVALLLSSVSLSVYLNFLFLKSIFIAIILIFFEHRFMRRNFIQELERWEFIQMFFNSIDEKLKTYDFDFEFSPANNGEWFNLSFSNNPLEYEFKIIDDVQDKELIIDNNTDKVHLIFNSNSTISNKLSSFPGGILEVTNQTSNEITMDANIENFYTYNQKCINEINSFLKKSL